MPERTLDAGPVGHQEVTQARSSASSRLGAVLLMLAPLFVLGSSASDVAAAVARALMVLPLGYAFLQLRSERLVGAGAALCIGGMVAAGLVHVEWGRTSTWTALVQALVLLAVVGSGKVVRLDVAQRTRMGLSLAMLAGASAFLALFGPASADFEGTLAVGPFGNPNAFGMAALAVGLLSFRLSPGSSPSRFRTWMRLVFLACVAVIVLSGSRTALLALLLFLVTYWLGRSLRVGRAVLSMAALALLLAIPLVTIGYALYLTDLDVDVAEVTVGKKEVLSGRNYIWPVVLARSAESPVTGHGLGRTPGDDLPEHYAGLSAHNGFLQILFQGGGVGLAFYVGLLIVLFRRALRLEDVESRAISVAALCAAILCEIFEVLLTQNHFGIGLVLWIAATVTVLPEEPEGSPSPAPTVEQGTLQARSER